MNTFLYAVAWLLFAVVHSALARLSIQAQVETYLGRWYRLLYNLLAVVSIGLVLVAGKHLLNSSPLFNHELLLLAMTIIQLAGLVVLVIAFTSYDIGRFTGITQLITGERVSTVSNEPLQTTGLNRWIRHPLYTGAILVLWGGAVSLFDLWTAIWGTLYFVIGTQFEERKLIRIYGDEYRRYQQEVPCYFPSISSLRARTR